MLDYIDMENSKIKNSPYQDTLVNHKSVTCVTEDSFDSDDEIFAIKCNYLNTFGTDCNNEDSSINDMDCEVAEQLEPIAKPNAIEILHRKWGHLSEGGIKRALKENMVKQSDFSYNEIKDMKLKPCFECMKGRMKALPHGHTTNHNWTTMQKIAIDFKGPFAVQSYHKKKGVMLISDYASNFVYAYLVRTKSESVEALEDFQRKIVKRYGYTTLILQSDADCIFTSKRVEFWLKKNNIVLELSAPYVHSQNGQIERDVQNVFDKTRTLMHSHNVPPSYWEFAVKIAVYLINRSPTTGRDVTPYEAVTGLKPSIHHLQPFWSPGVLHVTREERGQNPLKPKAEECRLLGYDEESASDAFIVLNLRTKRVVTRANCIFDPERIAKIFEGEEPEIIESNDGKDDLEVFKELRDEENIVSEPIDVIDQEEIGEPMEIVGTSGEKGNKYEYDSDDESGITDAETVSEFSALGYWESKSYFMSSSIERWHNEMKVLNLNVTPLSPNPKNIEDALSGPDGNLWEDSIAKEVDAFLSRDLWGIADQDGRAMKTKLIFTYKYGPNYEITRKTRIVVCGYTQKKGIDYIILLLLLSLWYSFYYIILVYINGIELPLMLALPT